MTGLNAQNGMITIDGVMLTPEELEFFFTDRSLIPKDRAQELMPLVTSMPCAEKSYQELLQARLAQDALLQEQLRNLRGAC